MKLHNGQILSRRFRQKWQQTIGVPGYTLGRAYRTLSIGNEFNTPNEEYVISCASKPAAQSEGYSLLAISGEEMPLQTVIVPTAHS
jgi:hypothetical protein